MKNISEFTNHWVAQNPGKNPMAPDFDKALADHANKTENFDWYT